MNGEDGSDTSITFKLCDWLREARVYNNNFEEIPLAWVADQVDAIVLYFSMRNVDRYNIMHEFYEIYKNTRHINLPIEVINIPMDDNQEDMNISYHEQAKWLTLKYNDPLILTLQYRYGITSVPHLLVMRTDGIIVSSHGILDLDVYGMNALISWISKSAARTKRLTRVYSKFDLRSTSLKAINHRKSIIDGDMFSDRTLKTVWKT